MFTAALFPDPKDALKEEHFNHHHSSHSASNGKTMKHSTSVSNICSLDL